MKTPVTARNNKKYCRYHRDKGHHTDDCQAVKQAIEKLIKKAYFKEYVDDSAPSQEKNRGEQSKKRRDQKGLCSLNLIFGGPHFAGNSRDARERYAHEAHEAHEAHHNPISMMSAEQRPRKVRREIEISFSEQDAAKLHHPHDDALVITPLIGRYNTQRMLVDNGRAVNILFASTFEMMNLDEANLKPASFPLYGFTRDHLLPKGTISLPVTLGDFDEVTKVIEFLVVDCPSAFNGILGRPLLRQFKVVTSIYHLKRKFPTPMGIGEVSGS
ncbi:uncharacterized protein LOC116116045 [Pistacia vera]|uniref:uncharacterized protein LOC116116045 n=1 Tax=Pistacia vera TaxID=55513 RepID=UPI0012632C5D|nr:uncharacterized protein LOC116116045 [Pistacia vera]